MPVKTPIPTRKTATKPKKAEAKKTNPARKPEAPTVLSLIQSDLYDPRPRWLEMVSRPTFHIAKIKPACTIDRATRRWIRNASDERAAQEGYRFDEARGQFTVDWTEHYCYLYEGDKAGEPMDIEDWQYEWYMQLYGWVGWSEEWDRWVRRYRRGCAWIPKKNAKSPTLAANGLYLLCGDSEQGQKCYTIARDKDQGLISHMHAVNMVKFSEELQSECRVYGTTFDIHHKPSNSVYKVVAADNDKSTEGFNGSLLVDEVHVVDFKIMKRVSRAGISRSEPLHIEMSTAGDNIDGYGMQQYKFAQRLLKGEVYDPETYILDFSVPPDTPIEALYKENDVIRLGKECNPSMGRIVRLKEYRSDWVKSSQSQTELYQFAMYRLNRWLAAGAAWIAYPDWMACRRKYTLEELSEFPCFLGLDLSKTLDITSLCICFAVPDEVFGVVPHLFFDFWMPEFTANMYKANIDFSQPEFKGWINLVKTRTIKYDVVASRVNWLYDNCDDVRCIAYDPYNSDTFIGMMENDYGWDEESLILMKQTMPYMGPPTADTKRLILNSELAHNDNPVMNWMMGHVVVDTDNCNNEKIVKPEINDYRKVDGPVSMVMAIAQMLQAEDVMSQIQEAESILLYERNKESKGKHGQRRR